MNKTVVATISHNEYSWISKNSRIETYEINKEIIEKYNKKIIE